MRAIKKVIRAGVFVVIAGMASVTASVTGDNILYWGAGLMLALAVVTWGD